jgi:protein-tyrosine-phosphatase
VPATAPPKILFVCTRFGGRSLLAAHLANSLSPWGKVAVAASFETGVLGRGYFRFMSSLGVHLSEEHPPSVFERFSAGERYDHVVIICSEESGELCRLLRISVGELFGDRAVMENWSVPDLSLIQGEPNDVRLAFNRVITQMEGLVQDLLRRLADSAATPASA